MSIVTARGLCKDYPQTRALDNFSMTVEPGRIVGLIGPNGSGKTTALQAILGLTSIDAGELYVQGIKLPQHRHQLMQNTAYIADTGTLPRWMKIADLLNYVANVHPNFDRQIADNALSGTDIKPNSRVRALSKGMQVQLHLAIVMAVQAQLLVLDEPTLGLDIIYRQQFYDRLLDDYFNEQRSIIITTHEVREIEHILTDVVLIDHGRAVLSATMDELPRTFAKLTTAAGSDLPNLEPLSRKSTLQGNELIFRTSDHEALAAYGKVSTPNLAELFVALVATKQPDRSTYSGEAA